MSASSADDLRHTHVAAGEAPIDSLFHQPVSQGLHYIYSDRYEAAVALFDSLQLLHPNHPAPYFYKAVAYQNWMLNFRINKFQNVMEENVERAIDAGNGLLKTTDDPWLHLYVGGAYGYRALHRFRKHEWISAYLDGRKGIEKFRMALRMEAGLYDCYFGFGSYNYWRTAKSRLVRIMAFWLSDNRQLGLEQMRLAIDFGHYSSREAAYGLAIAYYDNGDFHKALELNNEVMQYHDPPSLGALYMRGRLMAHFERWHEVEALNLKLLERLDEQSIGYQVECKYWIAIALRAQDRTDEAYSLTQQALWQSRMRDSDAELESAVEPFAAIMKRLVELNKELHALKAAETRTENWRPPEEMLAYAIK